PMHYAHLHNYLGIDEVEGPDFQQRARKQVTDAGARVVDAKATGASARSDGFEVGTEDETLRSDYLVLAAGKTGTGLAKALGVAVASTGAEVDAQYRTAVDRCYAVGRLARPNRSQAIISAGAGASAALDILSREAGDDVHDWDSPPKD
ncbi:MAG: FAD-dependent oxidoreductase, partial [Actinomycetota bacterium]